MPSSRPSPPTGSSISTLSALRSRRSSWPTTRIRPAATATATEGEDVATLFLHGLARFRGQALGWGLALFLMGIIAVVRYDLVQENQALVRQLLQGSIGQFARMFGDVDRLTTPGGFLSLAFFS